MALSLNTLQSGVRFGGGQGIWHYTTADAHSVVAGANYFDGAAALLSVGDVIHVLSSAAVSGTTGGGLKSYYVVSVTAGVVTVAASLGSAT